MSVELLSEAFQNFTKASKSLENYYVLLQKRVRYLTTELEKTNKELKKALSEAERNKDYLKAILYNLEEAIIVVDPDDRVTMLNKSAKELLGISRQEIIGKVFKDLELSIENGTGTSETLLSVRGRSYNVIISRSPILDSEDSLRGTVILIRDITRLKELEIQHERNQRLIAMGEMAAKIVHEIRNPLCSMELFASMLEKELDNKTCKELAKGISAGISNLNNILKNMLFFARPHKPAMRNINLEKVVEDSLMMFAPLLASRNINLKKSLLDCEISGDAELLKQVFINIVSNAIQSMPDADGGRLKVVMSKSVHAVIVEVEDSGEGIKLEDLEKIFNPFFSTKDAGTGLGLTIASKIMQAHGGYIKVQSEEGNGSVFRLYFPLIARAERRFR
ncbi:MAG: ATP-binding protein [Nitrospirota bacterium]